MALKFTPAKLPRLLQQVPATALDPHYVWASISSFALYGGSSQRFLAVFQMPLPGPMTPQAAQGHCARVFGSAGSALNPLWWDAHCLYGTVVVDARGLQVLEQAAASGVVSRFEVALIPEATRPAEALRTQVTGRAAVPLALCQEEVMLGVVDYGCPFASTRLRIATGTRVLDFWDQGGFLSIPGAGPPTGWNVGTAATSAMLDAWRGATPPGDDWLLYLNAGLPELCRDASHGAHVVGDLTGANTNPSLLWSGVFDRVPGPVASAVPATPDLVFVQLPSAYLQGVPRSALSAYRLAGLRYIVACAGPTTQRIVVPLSSENYEGSHDGQSLFDQASDALVDFTKTVLNKDLAIFVAAGNCLRTNTNERVVLAGGATHVFQVRVLPGNERGTSIELWLPQALDGLQFGLAEPGGANPVLQQGDGTWVVLDPNGLPFVGRVSLQQPSSLGNQRCVTFFIPPTLGAPANGGWVGDWRIVARAPAGAGGEVLAWIARSTPALGGKVRSYQSTFPRNYSSDWDFLQDIPADPAAARPYDDYSLSGLATANKSTVVGAYRARTGERSLYSAGGPGRPPSRHAGFRIDMAAPGDESRAVRGILGWGNRSAGNVRLAGTSMATPFAARVDARLRALPPTGAPVGRSDPPVAIAEILK